MAKKLSFMLTMVALFACLFALSVSAEVVTYDDITRTKITVSTDDLVVFDDGFTCPSAYICKDQTDLSLDFSAITEKTGKSYTVANVKELDIPEGIKSIAQYFFSKNTTLVKCSIPASTTTLNQCIFQEATALEELVMEHTEDSELDHFPNWMVWGCTSLKAFSMPDCITKMTGIGQFNGCKSMTALYLSKNLVSIDSGAGGTASFGNNPKMFFVNEPFTYDNIPTEKPRVYYFPSKLTSLPSGGEVFKNSTNLNDVLVFPAGVTSIANGWAFNGANAISIVFLGDMVNVSTTGNAWNSGITLYFCNEADKSASDLTGLGGNPKKVYCHADGNTTHLLEKTVSTEADCVNNKKEASLCFCGTEFSKQEVENTALGHEYDVAKGAIDLGIVYAEGFFKAGVHSIDCARCDVVENASVKPIFHWVGYSAKTFGDEKAFGQQYVINQKELGDYKAYVESQGDIFSYGVVAAGASSAGKPLSVVGNEVVNKEGAQSICFDQLSYDAFFMNISGIDAGSLDVALMCCAYVRVGDEIVYLDNNQTVDTVELTSFAMIDAIVNPKEDIA